MTASPLQPLDPNALRMVRLIATDMDGTLTRHGQFTPMLLQTLTHLAAVGMPVLIVTGRSAGWVSGLVHYLPIVGAIAENGGWFYGRAGAEPLVHVPDITAHRQALAQVFGRLQSEFPHIQASADNLFRLTDWTFDIQDLSLEDLRRLAECCQAEGWDFTYSTVQCHIKLRQQEKALGLQAVLAQYFPQFTPAQVVTVGDSPNDESLFDAARFPLSVGVANLKDYANQMGHLPRYLTQSAEVDGFCELAQYIIDDLSHSF